MICLRCDNEEFLLKQDAVIEQEFKGELFEIQMPAFACSKCEWITIDLQQTDELRKRTADAYRKKHGLLTSEEIKTLRKLLRVNQRQFATLIGVGEASIKRWETWLVQEKSSDELIRLKCEKELLRDQLGQNITKWFSFKYQPIEKANGITIQEGKPTTVKPSGGEIRYDVPMQEAEPQMLLCETGAADVYGPSPPRCNAEAFSFSMLSIESF